MRLVAASADASTAPARVRSPAPERLPVAADPQAIRLAGIETALATPGRIERRVRVPAKVVPERERVLHVVSKTGGWIERLAVRASGQRVEKGEELFTLFAPDLVPVQEEFLRVRQAVERAGSAGAGAEASRLSGQAASRWRQRLEQYGLPEKLLQELEAGGPARSSISFSAPASGFVELREVFEGQRVESGMELMTIADLSHVWVVAEVGLADAARLRPGNRAVVSRAEGPGPGVSCRVDQVGPFASETGATAEVRLRCPNPDLSLRPGMATTAELALDAEEGIVVPAGAVVETGVRAVVFVEREAGVFEPREVALGCRSEGEAVVRSGLEPGEKVAVRGTFLLDAQSRLEAAARAVAGGGGVQ